MDFLINPGDSQSQDFNGTGGNDVARIKPVINPNRGTMPGTNAQRAVRLSYQLDGPLRQNTVTGSAAPQYFYAYGTMFNDTDNLDICTVPYTGAGPAPPARAQVVEYYPLAFENDAISYGTNSVLDSLNDGSGNPVRDCNLGMTPTCDWHDNNLLVVRRAHDFLSTVRNSASDDFYTRLAYQDCAEQLPLVVALTSEFSQLKRSVVAHEVAHAMAVQHTTNICTDLMYVDDGIQRSYPMYLPYPTNYSPADLIQIAFH